MCLHPSEQSALDNLQGEVGDTTKLIGDLHTLLRDPDSQTKLRAQIREHASSYPPPPSSDALPNPLVPLLVPAE